MRKIKNISTNRRIQHEVRGVLRASCDVGAAFESFGTSDDGCYKKSKDEPWPGCSIGVRAPELWETKLSDAEVKHAFDNNLL
jgi:hypothetical protein